MFDWIARSWQFAKVAYGILWDHKKLLIFPFFSFTAAALILASFAAPLLITHTLPTLGSGRPVPVELYITAFLFYFCNYFVVIYFNVALIACVMQVINGEEPTISYGLSIAGQRLRQIIAWSFVSAVIGVILKALESHKKGGKIIAAILGTAWTIMTFFVLPAIVLEGVGPFSAIGSSIKTLKKTWGEGLVYHLGLGIINFLVMLPILAAGFLLWQLRATLPQSLLAAGGVMLVMLVVLTIVVISAAKIVHTAILYNYATGRSFPENVDGELLAQAFSPKG